MGNKLFGVDISGLIKANIGPGVLTAVLTKQTPGTRNPAQLTGGTNPTEASFTCRGFIDTQDIVDSRGTVVLAGQKVVCLIGDTISNGAVAPEVNDEVLIEGTNYVIKGVQRDPAAALYTCPVTKK